MTKLSVCLSVISVACARTAIATAFINRAVSDIQYAGLSGNVLGYPESVDDYPANIFAVVHFSHFFISN